jgi:soluble lytic murein transglycosylase
MDKIKVAIESDRTLNLQDKTAIWAQEYLSNKCEKFLELSKDESFPLKSMAFISALKFCDFKPNVLDALWETEEKNIPDWALEDYFEASLDWAIKFKNYSKMAYFKAKLSKYQPYRQGKEDYLLQAVHWDKKPQYLEMLYKVAPRFSPSDLKENFLSAGLDFERVRNFQKARSLYREIIERKEFSFKEKLLAFNQMALSYKKERNLDKFIEKIHDLEKWLKKLRPSEEVSDALVRCQLDLARAIWTEHQRDRGQEILIQLTSTKISNQNYQAEVFWVLGMMSLEKKEYEPALTWLEKALKLNISDLVLRDKINWAMGWNNYLLKKYSRAIFYFNHYEKITENFNLILKLKYWKAISYKKLKNFPNYKKEIKGILDLNPYSYYGILAHKELQIPFTPLKRNDLSQKMKIPEFEWLHALGEEKACKNFLKEYVKSLKVPNDLKEAIVLFHKINWYKEGIEFFNRIEPQERFSLHADYLSFVFPKPLEKDVKEISEKFSIQDSLIYSIARQESGFDQYARSLADAFGVMQVTPEVAKRMAKQFKIKYEKDSDLYDAKINFEIGSAVIKDLINRFEHDYISIVGSYNANYRSVSLWKKERFNGDYLEFIEMIPYDETQNFIKLVTRNYFLYKRLDAKKKFMFPKDFFNTI